MMEVKYIGEKMMGYFKWNNILTEIQITKNTNSMLYAALSKKKTNLNISALSILKKTVSKLFQRF